MSRMGIMGNLRSSDFSRDVVIRTPAQATKVLDARDMLRIRAADIGSCWDCTADQEPKRAAWRKTQLAQSQSFPAEFFPQSGRIPASHGAETADSARITEALFAARAFPAAQAVRRSHPRC